MKGSKWQRACWEQVLTAQGGLVITERSLVRPQGGPRSQRGEPRPRVLPPDSSSPETPRKERRLTPCPQSPRGQTDIGQRTLGDTGGASSWPARHPTGSEGLSGAQSTAGLAQVWPNCSPRGSVPDHVGLCFLICKMGSFADKQVRWIENEYYYHTGGQLIWPKWWVWSCRCLTEERLRERRPEDAPLQSTCCDIGSRQDLSIQRHPGLFLVRISLSPWNNPAFDLSLH